MCRLHKNPRLLVLAIPAIFFFTHTFAFGQSRTAGPPSTGSSSTGPFGNSNRGTIGSPNSIPSSTSTMGPYSTRPIFITGRVMFDDGAQPNSQIRIERVCGGNPKLEGHTDSKGRFSIQMDTDQTVDTEAADSSIGTMGPPGGQMPNVANSGQLGRTRWDRYWNCELRASYPGYRSDTLELASRRALDDPNVGTIILHRLRNVQGSTLSLTTALAPRRAQKEYEKGSQLAGKGKFEEAEKHLVQATDIYPKYAIAWFALGQVQQREGRVDDAHKSFESAISADPKYVSPYDQLALLSLQGSKWADAAGFSKQAITLNPVEFPSSFWYNAYANYRLKQPDEALKSAQALLRLDSAHHYPQAERLIAQIYSDKGDYADAAAHLRSYLALAPNAQDADNLKQMLAKMEQAGAAPKPPE